MVRRTTGILGRNRELAALDPALEDLDAGGSRILVVTGEPGGGETSLLAELAASKSPPTPRADAAEIERDLPFDPFVSALDEYLASRGDEFLR